MDGDIGVVIGKFMPYHQGHHNLIDFAQSRCNQLHVLIGDSPKFSIPAYLRKAWIEEDFPNVIVSTIPEEPMSTDNDVWGWRTIYHLGFAPDVVFSSEDYGDGYAAAMGAKHIMYDRERIGNPAQGHLIMENMWDNFHLLSNPAKAHFAKRVVLVGAESTGKTTLSRALAAHYDTVWIPEYGRTYWDGKINTLDFANQRNWRTSEFVHIVNMQRQMEDQLAHDANRVVICDTNDFATELWHERYMGFMSDEVRYANDGAQRVPALYILCGHEIPIELDGTRDDDLEARDNMQQRFFNELRDRHYPFMIAAGTMLERISSSVKFIDSLFKR